MSPKPIAFLALVGLAACDDGVPRTAGEANATWVSEPDYRFGDALAGDALFGWIPHLRVSPDGGRVFVLEPNEASVSVWTPLGRRVLELGGPGEGPGDFMLPYRIHLGDTWFYVRDAVRFTYFSDDGRVLRTVPNPPTSVGYQGFQIRVHSHLADGSFLGVPSIPATIRMGLWGDDPFHSLPVLRVRESDSGWGYEPVYWQDIRHNTLAVPHEDGIFFAAQPYEGGDTYWEDPGAGTVVVVRRSGHRLGPGVTELLEMEVAAGRDTVWQRRLELEAIRLTQAMREATIDGVGSGLEDPLPRDAVEQALYAPDYLPAVSRLTLASSGHVWLGTHEQQDTLRVWYSLKRGDNESPPRRILLPEWLHVMDATEAHVWGVWQDELDISYVVGRRLVPRS